jgi:ribonuclease Z
MEAKFTFLTHFSQRYSKIPKFEEIEAPGTDNVGVAFDNMTVSPQTFGLIRHTFPVLKTVFLMEKL